MYSGYHDRPDRALRVPENYSGCAFGERGKSEASNPSHRIDVAKPTPPPPPSPMSGMPPPPRTILLPPPKDEDVRPSRENDTPVQDGSKKPAFANDPTSKQEHKPAAFLAPFQGLFGNVGHAFPFTHGIGFDELLLLGLIILLSRSEEDSDLVLWLAILLFCG